MSNSIAADELLAETPYWQGIVAEVLKQAKQQGATSAEVNVGKNLGFSVLVRMGEVDTLEYHRDKGVSVTVYVGQRKGSASTSDISSAALEATVRAACRIAQLSNEDPCAGLAPPELMAYDYPALDLCHPWALTPEQAIELARECEQWARAVDTRIVNSEGAGVNTHLSLGVYGNSYGFLGSYASSRHSLNCTLVAQDAAGMQRDGYYTLARDPGDLESMLQVAKLAGERTVKRLGSRKLATCQVPVIFQAEVATGLLGSFLSAISGGNLYRKASFLVNQLGESIFAPNVTLQERPHLSKGLGSAPFDAEGVRTQDRDLVKNGVLQGYLLSSYSARKLGMTTTGNAGGAHNIFINTADYGLEELIKQMHKGLLITELMGQGINLVTGDYSRGVAGFWVENGEIQYPVEEITIAGNLRDMFKQIVAVANDVDKRSSIHTGSILIAEMMLAGE